MSDITLAELCITTAAESFRGDGDILATGIGLVPRLAASLAKMTFEPGLMMTDGEAFLVSEPVPVGPRGDYTPKVEGIMTYERVFDIIYRGHRHAMVGPVQIDRYGQTNISIIGPYEKPKSALLGVRGFPGNTISHANSMFVPQHSKRSFVEGEVDMVGGIGYNKARWPNGKMPKHLELRHIITNLCVMDFGGPDHAIRVISLHPGVTFDEVQEATSFPLIAVEDMGETPAPTKEQLDLIRNVLDPHNLRATIFKENPLVRKAA